MYTVTVKRRFTAFHFLVGGEFGRENERHAHRYEVAVRFDGQVLDRHGYLVDISRAEQIIEQLVGRYRRKTLNRLPEFAGQNPSIERFARVFCLAVCAAIDAPPVHAVTVSIAESREASASFRGYPVPDVSMFDRIP